MVALVSDDTACDGRGNPRRCPAAIVNVAAFMRMIEHMDIEERDNMKDEEPNPESPDAKGRSGSQGDEAHSLLHEEAPDDLDEDIEELLSEAEESSRALRSLGSQVGQAIQGIESCRAEIQDIHAQIKGLQTGEQTQQALNELSLRCQAYSEQSHEREVIQPICRRLIGVIDRISDKERRFAAVLENLGKGNTARLKLLRSLQKDRHADRIEMESVLADFGVEPFEDIHRTFNAATQHCVASVPSGDSAQNNQIAQRVRPGYQRHSKVIRREYVTVFVCDVDTMQAKEN